MSSAGLVVFPHNRPATLILPRTPAHSRASRSLEGSSPLFSRCSVPYSRIRRYGDSCSHCCCPANASPARLTHIGSALGSLGYVPQVCFSKGCQEGADTLFVVSVAIPMVVFMTFLAWKLRPVPQQSDGEFFEDSDTGTVFQAQPGQVPERDRKGELVFKAVSFTPYPIAEDAEGERIRIESGPVASTIPRTFVFEKVLPQPSELAVVTLERPLGLMVEEDSRRQRAVVAGVAEGSQAEQRVKLAGFDRGQRSQAALPGDVVRAFTCTNMVYPTKSLLFGMQPPERHIVVFGADGQSWERVASALKQGLKADGPVTLVLERRCDEGV